MNKRLLKAVIITKGFTVEDLWKKLKIDKSTYYRKVNSDKFTTEEVKKIINFLNLTENETIEIFFKGVVA